MNKQETIQYPSRNPEYTKRYRENNAEKRKEYQKKYRERKKKELREYNKEWAEKNREHVREYVRESNKRFRERHPEKDKIYANENPEKIKAQQILRYSIKIGETTRPVFCSVCGSTGKIHGHHPNYDKPLDVIWVCAKCHRAIHLTIEADNETNS